jgi:hypothetical protein
MALMAGQARATVGEGSARAATTSAAVTSQRHLVRGAGVAVLSFCVFIGIP